MNGATLQKKAARNAAWTPRPNGWRANWAAPGRRILNTTHIGNANGNWQQARDEAVGLLENRDYLGAVKILEKAIEGDPTGESRALLGLAHFQLEKYEEAANYYEVALHQDASNADWHEMLGKARANSSAEVHIHVPAVKYFNRDALLAPSDIRTGTLPAPAPVRAPIWAERVRRILGNALGLIASFLMEMRS